MKTITTTRGKAGQDGDNDDNNDDVVGLVDLLINLTAFVDPESGHELSISCNYDSTRNLTDKLSPLVKKNGQIILLSRPVTLFHLMEKASAAAAFSQETRRRLLSPDLQRADLDEIAQQFTLTDHESAGVSEETMSHILTMCYTLILREELMPRDVEVRCVCYGKGRDGRSVIDLVLDSIVTMEEEEEEEDDETDQVTSSCPPHSLIMQDARHKVQMISGLLILLITCFMLSLFNDTFHGDEVTTLLEMGK